MNSLLAEIYGTDAEVQPEVGDIEKVAAAELLCKLAEEEGVDLDQYDDEEIAGFISELYEGEKTAAAQYEPELSEDEQEKLAEADFLGRVMAHSFNQELGEIEKEAGEKAQIVKNFFGKGADKARGLVRDRGAALSSAGGDLKAAFKRYGEGVSVGGKARAQLAGKAARKAAPELAAAGGIAGAGGLAAALSGKKKEASAIEELAQQEAYELLKEAGWVHPETGEPIHPSQLEEYEEEKVAAPLQQVVQDRALELLAEAGWPMGE